MQFITSLYTWLTSQEAVQFAGAVMALFTAAHVVFLLLSKAPKVGPFFANLADWTGILAADLGKLLGKFPGKTAVKVGTAAIVLLCVSGCAASFEESRAAAHPGIKLAPPSPECLSLDDGHRNWSAVAASAGVLAGASGLAQIPDDSKELRIGLAAGTVAAGTIAAFATKESDGFAADWAAQCSGSGQ